MDGKLQNSDFYGLENLIKLNPNAPIFDPLIIDWQSKGLNKELAKKIYGGIVQIRSRLRSAGFETYQQGIISSNKIINEIDLLLNFKKLEIEKVNTKYAGNSCIVLTKSANGKLLIHPPYEGDFVMSWDKYLSKLSERKKLPLMNIAPWAQMKVINIE